MSLPLFPHEPARPPAEMPPWVLTFADLVSLVLTFFVLMFAVSELQRASWGEVSESLAGKSPATNAPVHEGRGAEYNIATVFRSRAIDLSYLDAVIAQRLAAEPELADIVAARAGDRLVVALPAAPLFAENGAGLSEDGARRLAALGAALRNVANAIGVAAPADPRAGGYEAGLARAAAVAGGLRAAGYLRDIDVHARPATRRDVIEITIFEGRGGG